MIIVSLYRMKFGKMSEKKMLDLVSATGEEATDLVLSEVLPEVVKTYGEYVVSEALAQLAGSLIGAVCPRVNSIILSYKQKRLERNVSLMLERIVANQDLLSARISALEASEEGRTLIRQSGELLLDGIVDEFEEDKVRSHVNGFINLLQTDDANMDMALMFFKTLHELNAIDLRVLTAYEDGLTIARGNSLIDESRLDYDQLDFVKEKLYRLGLLRSRNDEASEKNMDLIMEYLKKADKDARSSRPREVKLPSFKRTYSQDSYSITRLGRALLQLISEHCDLSGIGEDDPEEPETEED